MIQSTVRGFDELPDRAKKELKAAELQLLIIARSLVYHPANSESARKAAAALQRYTHEVGVPNG